MNYSALTLLSLLPVLPAAGTPEGPKRLAARVYDSGWAMNHDTWNGLGVASDGRVYYVLCSESIDRGGQMFCLDPGTGQVRHVGDLTEACGEKDLKAVPQGKSHVRFVESGGRLYFATHLAYYNPGGGAPGAKEVMAAPPPGYKPYPGGHFLAYDLAQGTFQRLASAPLGEGILTMNMDVRRARLYGLTWPTGYFLRYDMAKNEMRQFDPVAGRGEAGEGATYSTLCRAIVIDPRDGSAYLTTSAGDILRYRYDRDALETIAADNLRKDYFGAFDPTKPGHMGCNWRQALWYPPEHTIYAVHGNSGYLFRFDPRLERVEVLDRITSGPSRRSGMYDGFRYGYLGFALGPDERTLYYLTGGPIPPGEKTTADADKSKRKLEDLHLVTYDIPTGRRADHGAIFLTDGSRPVCVHSLDVGRDGTVYALSRVNRNGQSVPDLISIAPVINLARAVACTRIVVDCGRFGSPEIAAAADEEVDWLDADGSDDAACTQCFAAIELQRYLRQMTGREADFELVDDENAPDSCDVILVGRPTHAKTRALVGSLPGAGIDGLATLRPEAYRILSDCVQGRRLTLVAGAGRVGTLYAAYDLLYRLGCRWFAPGELHEEIPAFDRIPDLDVTQQPSFAARGFLAWENRGDRDFLLWMARNRLDYWTLEQQPHSLMHKLGIRMVCGRHTAESEFLGPNNTYPYTHPRFGGDDAKPRDPHAVSPEFQGDVNHDGRLSYFEAHPEWYAMVKGRRVPGIRDESFGTNFCTSNPDAAAEFVKNYARAMIEGQYRNASILRFWTLDAGKWCECDACKAQGTPTDRYLLLVRRFCQELDRARAEGRLHRPLEVTFLVYSDVIEPPMRPLPRGFPPDYCLGTFYPIRRCYVHRLDDPACLTNGRFCQQLTGWTQDPNRHYRGGMSIGEYYNVSRFKCLPICFMKTMAADIPYYHRCGGRVFDYMHVTTAHWGNKALTNYQMARQLWDIQTDCEALWDDYFSRRYGPAAATMREFYESLEQMLSNATELKYSLAPRLDRGLPDLFPNPHLRYRREPGLECDGPTLVEMIGHGQQCRRLLDAALAAPLSARVKARIVEDERGFTYGERTLAYYDACVLAYDAARAGRRDEAQKHYAEARHLAELLREDTISSQGSSSHANAENAFLATGACGALDQLGKLLGTVN